MVAAQAILGALALAGAIVLLAMGWRFRRWSILVLGGIVAAQVVVYLLTVADALNPSDDTVAIAVGVIRLAAIIACCTACLSSRGNTERLLTIVAGAGRTDPERGRWQL